MTVTLIASWQIGFGGSKPCGVVVDDNFDCYFEILWNSVVDFYTSCWLETFDEEHDLIQVTHASDLSNQISKLVHIALY